MYVFRFEDEKGVGAFMNYSYYGEFREASFENGKRIDPSNMPTPLSDFERGSDLHKHATHSSFSKNQSFCFTTLEQVLKFFGCKKGLDAMAKNGCHLYVYKVSPKFIKFGHHQAVFNKTKAKKVCKLVYEGLGCE